jgi:hypothetical protein
LIIPGTHEKDALHEVLAMQQKHENLKENRTKADHSLQIRSNNDMSKFTIFRIINILKNLPNSEKFKGDHLKI